MRGKNKSKLKDQSGKDFAFLVVILVMILWYWPDLCAWRWDCFGVLCLAMTKKGCLAWQGKLCEAAAKCCFPQKIAPGVLH